jgi:predicted sulfurtransferase
MCVGYIVDNLGSPDIGVKNMLHLPFIEGKLMNKLIVQKIRVVTYCTGGRRITSNAPYLR